MIIYSKILDLCNKYLEEERNADDTEIFCNQYMNMFFDNSDELENEVSQEIFEMLDDVNLACDSYEKNPEIRKEDSYCIDKGELRERIENQIKNLNNF